MIECVENLCDSAIEALIFLNSMHIIHMFAILAEVRIISFNACYKLTDVNFQPYHEERMLYSTSTVMPQCFDQESSVRPFAPSAHHFSTPLDDASSQRNHHFPIQHQRPKHA